MVKGKFARIKVFRPKVNSGFIRIAGLQIATKGIGFLREILIARFFGISQYADAYVIGQNIFNLFAPLISDALQTVGTPILSKLHSKSKLKHLHIASVLIAWGVLISLILAAATALFIEPLLKIITPGINNEVYELVKGYIYLLIPYAVIFSISGAFAAFLNSAERFGLSEVGMLIINAVSVALLLVINWINPRITLPLSLSLSFVIGAVYFFRVIKPYVTIDLYNELLLPAKRVIPAMLVSYGLVQINFIVDRYFASTLPTGTFAATSYANKILFLPLSIISTSINTIAFVRFSKLSDAGDSRRALAKTSLAVALSLLPFAIVLALFPTTIITLLFKRGAFDYQAVELTAKALKILSTALIALGVAGTLQKQLYAEQRSSAVMRGTLVAVLLAITTNYVAVPRLGIQGLMLAVSVSNWGLVAYLFFEVFKVARNDKI